ncbi:MAG TPA: ArdC-like ssDNA-binding domain-containing protein, partial [Acetobacteraceae bacterium]
MSTTTRPVYRGGKSNRAPRDHYQEVTGRIVAALEAGTPPWRRPWDPDKAGGPAMPRNAATGQRYRGINVLTLGMSALAFESGDPRWATYKQAEDGGWQVRRGERGTTRFFFKRLELRDDKGDGAGPEGDEEAVRRIPLLRAFTLFHASQIDGIPDYIPPTIAEAPWRAPEAAEIILANSGAIVRIRGERAFYSPATDHIQMPPQPAFATAEGFCGTLIHELGHWTGAGSRLNRDLRNPFGSHDYAREKLRGGDRPDDGLRRAWHRRLRFQQQRRLRRVLAGEAALRPQGDLPRGGGCATHRRLSARLPPRLRQQPGRTTGERVHRRRRRRGRRAGADAGRGVISPFPINPEPSGSTASTRPGPRGCPYPNHEETTMPNDTEFTLSLFDNTPLSGWTHHTLQAASDPDEIDQGDDTDAEDDGDTPPSAADPAARGGNFHLAADRELARGWPARARGNIAAISLSKTLEQSGLAPTADEQAQLLRFTGFGASELAQNCFRRPGEDEFRPGWQEIGAALEAAVTSAEYAALQRATQYAHYTPETIIRGLWRAAERLGFSGGRVLEPGMGTGLFFVLLPMALRETCHLTGIEYDPITARIARLVHPETRVRCEDYTRSPVAGRFDLVIGNPPFSDRVVRADPVTRALGLRLHDYFIARSIARLRPGGIALFITSTGTMDKVSTAAREHIAGMADLVGAVRLPEGSMRAAAGTDVVIDVLVFQRRADGQPPAGAAWIDLAPVERAMTDADDEGDDTDSFASPNIQVNRYFAEHPEMVLGDHALRRGIYGPAPVYTCRPRQDGTTLETLLTEALDRLPAGIFAASPESLAGDETDDETEAVTRAGTAADDATIKEGSYLPGTAGRLMQIVDGEPRAVAIKEGKGSGGIFVRDAKIIRALLPIRDAVREVLRAQAADQPWAPAQVRLRIAYSSFVRSFGPINHTVVSVTFDPETGEERETHRRPNLAPFADDPDCWLVASIEDYDLESGLARMGPIFRERVIAPPSAPLIATAADALAVTLNETGRVDIDHLAELLDRDPETALAQLGEAVFR